MSEPGERVALWPPQSNLIETMLRTCCHYCGQQVVGPAPALTDWRWRHRLSCKHPVEAIHEVFWQKWAGGDPFLSSAGGPRQDRTRNRRSRQ